MHEEIKEGANNYKRSQTFMNKSSKNKRKPAPNAERVPGSPESSRIKNKEEFRDNIPTNLEKNEFWADNSHSQMIKTRIPTVIKDPKTGRETVMVEEHEFEASDDYHYQPSKNAKKRMKKRRLADEQRAKNEVVIHGLKETIYEDDDELYWRSEANKVIKFSEELSPDYLGEDGLEITLEDINVTNRIFVWTGKHDENNPLPMVVQLKDEDTANAMLRSMYAAGCHNRRVHVKRGKFKKTGDKETDKAKEAEIKKLKGCYGRPSTTKGQRDAARKKKEYLASQEFNKKKSFQEFKQEREVNFVNIRSKYTIKKSNGTRELVKKPKTNHRNNTGTGSEGDGSEEDYENDEDSAEWCIGDYCRVVCDFDGLVHEAKIMKQYQHLLCSFFH